ncbi:glycogen/starch/alpha-glucan phosphorylase [Verrucomicrobium spinosum]|uniref:glycogen/starch/alpha-glucan phosphorylase n=1 Tax=Verrucomicrobium spinosum TaxID=2736 RepID=UPI000174509C|nr:glycogen/starch/alpha-glucan phosphorylase [Verrucomicrobium spinosum]
MWQSESTPSPEAPAPLDDAELAASLKASIRNHLLFTLAHDPTTARRAHWWTATCMAVRDRALAISFKTMAAHRSKNTRRVNYLSLEYLMGRLLENNLRNTGLYDAAKSALGELGQDLETIINEEADMGLGNGGLGRLAACFLDSLSTLDLPAVGYGIHYEFGLFRQEFVNGRQVEQPDPWIRDGNPWNIVRPEYKVEVNLYGRAIQHFDDRGNSVYTWENTKKLVGLPWDIPIIGFDSKTVNFLRLWESRATDEFNLRVFNEGSYIEALHDKAAGETVSKILYPNDATESGKELRLVQQYFFVACSLSDIIRRYKRDNQGWDAFPEKVAIQLNDTHPAVAIPELMRLLTDVESLPWLTAWSICQRTFCYTNHTLLPEALETWSVPLFERVLPRHLQIIYAINQHLITNVISKKWPDDVDKIRTLSLIDENGGKSVRMAHLSVHGSRHTNGVAALHTRLLKEKLFPEFNELYPDRFLNMTNGITPRRWLMVCNPELTSLINESIGTEWTRDASKLKALESFAEDPVFQQRFRAIKRLHKERLTHVIKDLTGYSVSADAIFDVQIKRLHEYKRQHLNLLNILTLYRRLLQDPGYDMQPRVFIFAAKAAPGYYLAKNIIFAINAVAEKINNDPRILGKLKVVFLPNYGVTLAERIIPAADISEQISTAGKEASGTGNMKLALNGALTIGTLDGANVEIKDEVGDDNIFIFGLTVEEVEDLRQKGYNPWDYYWNDPELRNAIDWIGSDFFTGNSDDFKPLRSSLLEGGDPFLCCADYRTYVDTQGKVDAAYRDSANWTRMSILNTARMGFFSSDRTISEYAEQIWNLPRVEVG